MTEEQNIILDKEYLDEMITKTNTYLNTRNNDFFYLPSEVTIKSLTSDDKVTIKYMPFVYWGRMYYMVHSIRECGTRTEVCPILNHVNISRNITWIRAGIDIEFECYAFCTGGNLNYTQPEKHFANQELIKTTLAMILPFQNPSNAYYNAENYIGLINPEHALKCRQCSKSIAPDSSVIELILCKCGAHVTEADIDTIRTGVYYGKSRTDNRYKIYETRPSNTTFGSYRIITPEEITEALKGYELSIDSIFVGCGSAGSNIGSQLSRTDLIENGILIDFDKVERNNLRNQDYGSGQIGYPKAEQLSNTMLRHKSGYYPSNPFRYMNNKIQEVNLDLYKAKYLFNCVDSLTARLYAIKNAKTRYIIDTRYHGLDCSIFFIDTEDEEQMKYYISGLEQAIQTFVKDVSIPKDLLTPNNCNRWSNIRRIPSLRNKSYSMLKKYTDKFYNSIPLEDKERLLHLLDKERQTCNSPNIIDIYSISAGIIVGMLRELENGNKLFTHLELTTQNVIPQTMIVRK